jgi:hypothetical protein
MNLKNPQNPSIRSVHDADKKGRLRWCFSPTKYKAIDLLTTQTRVKREGTKKTVTPMN